MRYLHRIFFPKSIAVFGVGDKEAPLADRVIRNIRSSGYRGSVFGVCSDHSDLESIEGTVDLGILSAPSAGLAKAIQSFAKVKPAGVIVVSHANVTSDLRREVLMCARSADIRLIGPHSWVGFLGAGTILHTRGQITGLTSAATIWVVAGIGLTIGAGYFIEALGSTLTVMMVLIGLGWVEKKYLSHAHDQQNGVPPGEWDQRPQGRRASDSPHKD